MSNKAKTIDELETELAEAVALRDAYRRSVKYGNRDLFCSDRIKNYYNCNGCEHSYMSHVPADLLCTNPDCQRSQDRAVIAAYEKQEDTHDEN